MSASTGREWLDTGSAYGKPVPDTYMHRLNMELDLQSLFGLLCTAVLSYSLAPPQSEYFY
jgi:hypothetical protein